MLTMLCRLFKMNYNESKLLLQIQSIMWLTLKLNHQISIPFSQLVREQKLKNHHSHIQKWNTIIHRSVLHYSFWDPKHKWISSAFQSHRLGLLIGSKTLHFWTAVYHLRKPLKQISLHFIKTLPKVDTHISEN